jgi:hypothetical protein
MKKKRNLFLIVIFIVPLVFIFSQCLTISKDKKDPRGDIFAGSSTCIKCHKDVYDNYLHTSHFSTTRLADIHSIGGSFKPHDNTFYFNKDLKVVMEQHADGLYQVTYLKGKQINTARFDITFGEVKAESYLYWNGNSIYQLPMSYFKSLKGWTNSPGFDSTYANYSRMIGRRCFECHSSYIKDLPAENQALGALKHEEFDKNSLILGIDCERCHGPAANHVNYQTTFPEEKKARYIATYASLSRAQKINMCAVCHSGNKNHILKTTFVFKPGDDLADFVEAPPYEKHVDSANLDVHANQSQLLASSKCFVNSNMDCATCHDVHKNERGNLALFSQKCMNCHTTAKHNFCPMAPKLGAAIKNNCIDCHMPARSSNIITVETEGKGRSVPYFVRTHHIAIYNDASQKIIDYINKSNKLTSK